MRDQKYQSRFFAQFDLLPRDYKWKDVLAIINGKAYGEEYQEEGKYPICGSAGVMGYGNKKLCEHDTIILGRKGNIDKPIYMNEDYWIVDTAFCLLPKKDIIHPVYLYYWCKQFDFQKLNKQAVLPSLTRSDLEQIEIQVPKMEDQMMFVKVVQQADKSKFNGFKSRFIEQFSGESISRVPLSDLCTLFIDGDWIEAKDQSDSGYRLVQTGNIGICEYLDKKDHSRYVSDETFKRLNCTEIHSGDILFSRLPDPIGRCCIIPWGFPKAITAVDCTITRLKDNCLPEYLMVYTTTTMYSEQIKKCITGTTRQRISRGNLAKITVPLPNKQLQAAFVSLVYQADKSKYLS